MRKLTLLVAMLMTVLMIAAAPALAQEKAKGKGKAKAAKKEKATPETGGTLVDASILGLGAGALMVGSGLVVRRIIR